MGNAELIRQAQRQTSVKIKRHHVAKARKQNYVKPTQRIGNAYDYPPTAVDGLLTYLASMRPWQREMIRP